MNLVSLLTLDSQLSILLSCYFATFFSFLTCINCICYRCVSWYLRLDTKFLSILCCLPFHSLCLIISAGSGIAIIKKTTDIHFVFCQVFKTNIKPKIIGKLLLLNNKNADSPWTLNINICISYYEFRTWSFFTPIDYYYISISDMITYMLPSDASLCT